MKLVYIPFVLLIFIFSTLLLTWISNFHKELIKESNECNYLQEK